MASTQNPIDPDAVGSATVVRMVLVPAVMQLLGPANWWLPSWLGRAAPHPVMGTNADHAADGGLAYTRRR